EEPESPHERAIGKATGKPPTGEREMEHARSTPAPSPWPRPRRGIALRLRKTRESDIGPIAPVAPLWGNIKAMTAKGCPTRLPRRKDIAPGTPAPTSGVEFVQGPGATKAARIELDAGESRCHPWEPPLRAIRPWQRQTPHPTRDTDMACSLDNGVAPRHAILQSAASVTTTTNMDQERGEGPRIPHPLDWGPPAAAAAAEGIAKLLIAPRTPTAPAPRFHPHGPRAHTGDVHPIGIKDMLRHSLTSSLHATQGNSRADMRRPIDRHHRNGGFRRLGIVRMAQVIGQPLREIDQRMIIGNAQEKQTPELDQAVLMEPGRIPLRPVW